MARTEKRLLRQAGPPRGRGEDRRGRGARLRPPLSSWTATIFYPEGGGQSCDLGSLGGRRLLAVTEAARRQARADPPRPGVAPRGRAGASVGSASRRGAAPRLLPGPHGPAPISATPLRLAGRRDGVGPLRQGSLRYRFRYPLPSEAQTSRSRTASSARSPRTMAARPPLPARGHRLLPAPQEAARDGEEALRVVEIEGIDFTPCCGLHLARPAVALRADPRDREIQGHDAAYFLAGAGRPPTTPRCRASRRMRPAAWGPRGSCPRRSAARPERRRELELALAPSRESARPWRRPRRGACAPRRDGQPALALRRYQDRDAASLMATAKAFAQAGLASSRLLPDLTVQALSPEPRSELGSRLKGPLGPPAARAGRALVLQGQLLRPLRPRPLPRESRKGIERKPHCKFIDPGYKMSLGGIHEEERAPSRGLPGRRIPGSPGRLSSDAHLGQ